MSHPDPGYEAWRVVRITNAAGLHARPCHALVALTLQYDCEFRVGCNGRQVNGRSILELMTLGAGVGTELSLVARGPGAQELVDRAACLVASGFDETG